MRRAARHATGRGIAVMAVLFVAGCAPPSDEASTADARIFAPMGEPRPDLTEEERATFARGREVMARRFGASDGLGPGYTATFCGGCHEKPVPGGTASRYRNALVRPSGGDALVVDFQPDLDVTLGRAPDVEGAPSFARSPLPLFGAGLLAEIPVEEILHAADPNDVDGDGISGRVGFERGFVGRFGRKAQMATLMGFVRLALFDHLGITTDPVVVEGLEPRGPIGLPTVDADDAADPELPADELTALVSFVAMLAAPEPDAPTAETERGRARFDEAGCAGCHLPSLRGPRGPVPAYTDLLLHDMGDGLADGVAVDTATPSEFRTTPLWGIATAGPYLHDGRADTLDEAIRAHGGEAEGARARYEALGEGERAAIVAFLRSLGGSEHRADGLLPLDGAAPETGELGGPQRFLAENEREAFARGRALFDHDFGVRAGLGPLFNGDACRSCHFDPVIGGAGPSGVDAMRHGTVGADGGFVAPPGGTVAHRHDARGPRPAVGDGANLFEPRQTPPLFGLGLVDAIPDEAILARADPDDADGDGIRGTAHVLADGRLGRFGWKAAVPTLADFARDALSTEVGLTVPTDEGSGFGRSTDGDDAADPEIAQSDIDDLVLFMRELGPLAPLPLDAEARALGAALFEETGCAACHAPELETRDGVPVPLYSDLLLHDVAPPDEPTVSEGASTRGFRTAPLWGLARTAPYMHDGRAESIEAAILRHAGEATSARDAFAGLAPTDEAALLRFLEAL